jgi:hypothetical protein
MRAKMKKKSYEIEAPALASSGMFSLISLCEYSAIISCRHKHRRYANRSCCLRLFGTIDSTARFAFGGRAGRAAADMRLHSMTRYVHRSFVRWYDRETTQNWQLLLTTNERTKSTVIRIDAVGVAVASRSLLGRYFGHLFVVVGRRRFISNVSMRYAYVNAVLTVVAGVGDVIVVVIVVVGSRSRFIKQRLRQQ